MKQLSLLLVATTVILFTRCTEESLSDPELSGKDKVELRAGPDLITICHQNPDGSFSPRQVHPNALQPHLNHGDYHPDADGDGYTKLNACTGSADDCDDNNAAVHPGAIESCNGIDDNCNGEVDADDIDCIDAVWYFADNDNDGYGSQHEGNKFCSPPEGWVDNIQDCDDENPGVHQGAFDIPNDGIDQDCMGGDSVDLYCPCFSTASLNEWLQYEWLWGWWSDVPGSCKEAPYDQLLELAVYNGGSQEFNFNFGAQAGYINGAPFASSAIFNHTTQQFDLLCGGYTTAEIAEPCRQILSNFIQQLRVTHPEWDYCERF